MKAVSSIIERIRQARKPILIGGMKLSGDPLVAHCCPGSNSKVVVLRAGKPYAGYGTAKDALEAVQLWRKHCPAFEKIKLELVGPGTRGMINSTFSAR